MGIRKVILVDWSDIIGHAVYSMGYSWNDAHEILLPYCPQYELKTLEICIEEIEEYTENEDAIKIVKEFFDKNNLTEITVVPD